MTKAWTLTVAVLAATLTLAGCAEDAPGMAAAPDAEPGDPAVYAPDGWPLEIGDKVSHRRRWELNTTFPGLGGVEGINVVNGRTYGARWSNGVGWLPDEDFSRLQPLQARLPGSHRIYEGHFPEKVPDTYWQYERERLPQRFHGRIEYYENVMTLSHPEDQRRWEERRARMRAEGLLPTPSEMSPTERKR